MSVVQCPECGKLIRSDANAALMVCMACGSRFALGQAGNAASAPAAPAAPADDDWLSASAPAARLGVQRHPTPGARLIALMICTFAVVLGGAVIFLVLRRSPDPPVAARIDGAAEDLSPVAAESKPVSVAPATRQTSDAAVPSDDRASKGARLPEPDAAVEPQQEIVRAPPAPAPIIPAAPPGRPPPSPTLPTVPARYPVPPNQPEDLDTRIGHSMQKAVDFLLSQFDGAELGAGLGKTPTYRIGLQSLCVYALLQAGLTLPDERLSIHGRLMPRLVDSIKSQQIAGDPQLAIDPVTYAHSLRAAALAVYDRPEDRATLKADVAWLVAAETNGTYTYDDRYARRAARGGDVPWDNSNSQYGLLAVWAGAEAGMEVPDKYWRDVERHWKTSQARDGQWIYSPYQRTLSLAMNAAGVASLMVTHDYLDAPMWHGAVGREPFPGQLGLGLKWLEAADHAVQTPNANTFYIGYDLYGLERVGLATGLKFLGAHDWYRELAEKVLAMQWPSGAFAHEQADDPAVTDTAYTLLFLARGRWPIFMNKLRFGRFWSNRPCDVANLARFASHELERPLNWQVVSVERPWSDWLDAPVLYIASHQPPPLTEADYAKLRSFVLAGGLIFTHADAGSEAFNQWVPKLVEKVCPEHELQELPADHLLYSVDYRIGAVHPKLLAARNGSRLLIVHSPTDLGAAWQGRDQKRFPDRFRLGVNLFVYAAGKRDYRNRLQTTYVPQPSWIPARSIAVARLKYAGNWDPEPYAWTRFGHLLMRDQGQGIELATTQIEALKAESARLAHLTGTAQYDFNAAQIAAIKQYVSTGGVLLIDSCGGDNAFTDAARGLLRKAFPDVPLQPIPPEHPLYAGLSGAGSSPLALRPYAAEKLGRAAPPIQLLQIGSGCVVFSPLDLTSGMLGTNTWGVIGYAAPSAERFLSNLIAWIPTRKL